MTEPRDALRIPAIGLMVNAGGVIIANLVLIIGTSLGMTLGGMGVFGDAEVTEKITNGAINIASSITGILVCTYIVWSALQMLKLQNRSHAIAGAVLSMIPCFTVCCCITSAPFAIWALVVLRRPEVESAFQ